LAGEPITGGDQMYKNIVLAYDGSVGGALALREGALLAKTSQAKVTLLSVIPHTPGPVVTMEGVGGLIAQPLDGHKDLLERAVQWLQERGIEPEAKLIMGEPTQTIGAVVKEVDADLVVVGYRRESLLARWWSGTTHAFLSDHVTCSVLIARNPIEDGAFEETA